MDMANISLSKGDARKLAQGNKEDYVTTVDVILPFDSNLVKSGEYSVEYHNQIVQVYIRNINSKEDDPIFKRMKGVNIGTSNQSGLPDVLPLEIFTDNKGVYPAVLASIVFPYRIATWTDANHQTGLKMDYDYEAMRITGPPENSEKVLAILVINRLLDRYDYKNIKKLVYDDITTFNETYFKKGYRNPIYLKVNALASKSAYKNAVINYYLKDYDKTAINYTIHELKKSVSPSQISTEKDLYDIILKIIEEVLIHNIEYRRWIEPFWDGQRKVQINKKEIKIPMRPKDERSIQPTLHVLFDIVLTPIGIQVIRESNEGIGSIDFRFLYTTPDKTPLSVGSEFKIAHHKQIKKGVASQLPAYLKSMKSHHGIFMVMWFKDSKYFKEPKERDKGQMTIWLEEQAKEVSVKFNLTITSRLIDASIRPSASML